MATISNQISKRVINSASGGRDIIHRRRFLFHRVIVFCGIMVLWGSKLQGGIKEEVEKSLINQFGDSAQLSMKKMMLTKEMRIQIEKKVHQRFFKDFIYVWAIEANDSVKAYGLLDNVKGLSMPITFLVIFDPSGVILNTSVIKYREPYGGEISSPGWTTQFKGRNATSNFAVGGEIDGISGATISVYSMATGVMKLSMLFPLIKAQL